MTQNSTDDRSASKDGNDRVQGDVEREQMIHALRESEQRFRSVLENSIDFVYRYNLQTSAFDYVSPSVEDVTGYSVEDYLALTYSAGVGLVHPEDRDSVRNTIQQLGKAGHANLEYRLLAKSGEYRWLSNHMTIVTDEYGKSAFRYGSVRNISSDKSVAEALQIANYRLEQANNFLNRVTDLIPGILSIFNIADKKPVFINNNVESLLGFSMSNVGEMGPDAPASLMHPEDLPRFDEHLEVLKMLNDGETAEFEHRMIDVNGNWHWFHNIVRVFSRNGDGSVKDVITIALESTDRKNEQQQLQRLAAIVKLSKDFIGIFNLKGQTLFVNDAGRSMVGINEEQCETSVITDFLFPEDVPYLMEFVSQVLAKGTDSVETRFRHFQTGEEIAVDHLVVLIHDVVTGKPCALATVTRDIREEKRLEAERADIAKRREKISEAVQRSLLLAPADDAYPGIITHHYYQSAYDEALIGGDFFDVFALTRNIVALVVGDATGKGIAAATYTAEIKFALRAFLREHRTDLATAISKINNFIMENLELDASHSTSQCVALTSVLINTATGQLDYVCAGAEPPLILSDRTGKVLSDCEFGPLLGVEMNAEYTVTSAYLESGDVVLLTTDGITEAKRGLSDRGLPHNRAVTFFGREGVADVLKDHISDDDLQTLVDKVVGKSLNFANGVQRDDICIVAAKRL